MLDIHTIKFATFSEFSFQGELNQVNTFHPSQQLSVVAWTQVI